MASYTPKSLTLEKNGDSFIYNFDDKVDKNQGIGNAGKALGIDAQGMVEPVEFSGDDFTGATASTAGVHGYVPAPSAGDQEKVLYGDGTWKTPAAEVDDFTGATASLAGTHGLVPAPAAGEQNYVLKADGTWAESPGAKMFTVSGTIANASGSYTGTFSDDRITPQTKPILLELGSRSVFHDEIAVTPGNGVLTITCSSVSGTSTFKVSLQKVIADPTAVTSTEFDILNNRITALTSHIMSGIEADAGYHLGFYLDENGDLCQADPDEEEGD